MKKGFTLIETLIVIIIIAVLVAVALPYYRNAVESARMAELVILWGQQKNFATGYNFTQEQAEKFSQKLQEVKLKHFTGRLFCRENVPDVCWEAEFTKINTHEPVQYKLQTVDNFRRLACLPLNHAGQLYCESQANEETPLELGEEKAYLIR